MILSEALILEIQKRKVEIEEGGSLGLKKVKDRYNDVADYISTFEPLLFEEVKAQISQKKDDNEGNLFHLFFFLNSCLAPWKVCLIIQFCALFLLIFIYFIIFSKLVKCDYYWYQMGLFWFENCLIVSLKLSIFLWLCLISLALGALQ